MGSLGYNARMNLETVHILNDINESFYRANGASFDRSRRSAWRGWDRAVGHLVRNCTEDPLRIIDNYKWKVNFNTV